MEWFASKGALVVVPLGHSPHWDFIAEFDDALVRVQVKTCACWVKNRWSVTLCTRGGNRSWNGIVKRLDRSRCDYLFVLVADGRRWCIPASVLNSGSHISLGGPKYSEFEVDRGRPLPPRTADQPASTIVSLDPRGDVRAAKGDAL
jgi:PD-(D/E)XK endonuclease